MLTIFPVVCLDFKAYLYLSRTTKQKEKTEIEEGRDEIKINKRISYKNNKQTIIFFMLSSRVNSFKIMFISVSIFKHLNSYLHIFLASNQVTLKIEKCYT